MVQLLSVVGVVVSALAFGAVAFPTGPGTCLVSGMTGVPHGSKPTLGGGYSLTITPVTAASAAANTTTGSTVKPAASAAANTTTSSMTSYEITLDGNGSFTGLLLYALDTANNNTRFGAFVKPPAGFGPHVGCKGVDPAANTLGHINAKVKKLPVKFTWTPAQYNPAKPFVASFTGVVMTANAKIWYALDQQSPGTNSTPSVSPSPAPTPAAATSSLATSANTNASATSTTSSAAIHSRSSVSSLALVALLSVAALWL